MQHSSSSWSASSTPTFSRSGSSSTTRTGHCIIVVVAAYSSLGEKTLRCSLDRMERSTRRVIIISCLTLIKYAVAGVELPVNSVNDGVRDAAKDEQLRGLQLRVQSYRKLFEERQAELLIDVKTGETNERIVKQVARELHPLWIIVDSTLLKGRQERLLQQALEDDQVLRQTSNLAFVRGGSRDPVFLLSRAFFEDRNADISVVYTTTNEERVEEDAHRSSVVGCCNGLFTCWQGSTSSSRRTLTRGEDRANFHTRAPREANDNT